MPYTPITEGDSATPAFMNARFEELQGVEVFNVKIPTYGAVGDGTTDDTSAVQAAIDAAEAAGGGIVYFPFSSLGYVLSDRLTVTQPIVFLGYDTLLNVQLPLVHANEDLFEVNASNVWFVGLHFDGSNAPPGTLSQRTVAIHVVGTVTRRSNIRVMNCRFTNFNRRGALDVGSPAVASTASEYGLLVNGCDGLWITDCVFDDISGVTADIRDTTDGWYCRNRVAMLASGDEDLYPVHLRHSNDGIHIEDNRFTRANSHAGGTIDVMSIGGETVNRRIFIRGNVVDGTSGGNSGTARIRVLSVDGAIIENNIIRGITSAGNRYITLNYRDLATEQEGPIGNIVANNILECGAAEQVGIDVRNENTTGAGGEWVKVTGNIIKGDGTNFFAGGIRMRDTEPGQVLGNHIEFSRDTAATFFVGINIVSFTVDITNVVVENNFIDGRNVASAQGITTDENTGRTLSRTILRNNVVTDCPVGMRELNGENAIVTGNFFDNVTTPLQSFSGGTPHIRNNIGWTTENNGTATLVNGTTSIAVNHGLSATPAIHDISVTPIEAWGAAAEFWISTPTSTQFTINVDADPTQDVDFAWTASIQ